MNDLIKEYPKALGTFLGGVLATYLTGKIPDGVLTPEVISGAQVVVGAGVMWVVGKFSRLTKSESKVMSQITKKELETENLP